MEYKSFGVIFADIMLGLAKVEKTEVNFRIAYTYLMNHCVHMSPKDLYIHLLNDVIFEDVFPDG